ncbi:hypothetical protein NXY00_23865 [Bacteroides sp. BFG-551]|nr:hypothetical protein [Bacteroides sp. BFG-551]
MDAFTMKDGSNYTHSSDGENMYNNRDPRRQQLLDMTVRFMERIPSIRELVII